jgi:tripeptide aminopeptidase
MKGKAAHAGFAPEKGIHAVQAAAKAVAGLKMGHIDSETTLNIGRIEGGLAANIIPDTCTLLGEIRSYSHDKALQTAEQVREIFIKEALAAGAEVHFETQIHCEAYQVPVDRPVTQRFKSACESVGLEPSLQKTFGGSDNHHLVKNGLDGLVLANAMNSCHSCEEYTSIEELCRITQLTLALMLSQD